MSKHKNKDEHTHILVEPPTLDDVDNANRDPITKEPGAHPIGTGLGAAGAGAAGAAIGGAIAGPVGAAIGAAAGAIAGGLGGKGAAEGVNPTTEHQYWQDNYSTRPYVRSDAEFDDYKPAYQLGWESRTRHEGKEFHEVEHDLGSDWDKLKGESRLKWEEAKHATKDAWERVSDRTDSDRTDSDRTDSDRSDTNERDRR
jgi:hypothetical protein